MTESTKFHDPVIMTIPYIEYPNGKMILVKIGDVHRFSYPVRLLAFSGFNPSVYWFGNYTPKRTRMSKRGSRTSKYVLSNAVHNVVKNNATFKACYNKKITEGLTHYNAIGYSADKVEFNLD